MNFSSMVICLDGGPDQRRLLKYLFEDSKHDPLERPVQNDSHSLPVSMGLAIQQIIDFVSVASLNQISYRSLKRFRMKKMKFYRLAAG